MTSGSTQTFVCETVWGGGGGGGVQGREQNRLDLQLSQRSLGSDTCDIASCWRIVQDTAVAVHKYACVHVRKCKYGERSQMRC